AVDTAAATTNLIARLLLETGRAGEARRLLQRRVDQSRGAPAAAPSAPPTGTRGEPSAAVVDREAAWPLGRAALQCDQHEMADAMLELAGGFGAGDTNSYEPAPFVGSRRCEDCHPSIYREQQRESPHARTIAFGPDLAQISLPGQPVPDP